MRVYLVQHAQARSKEEDPDRPLTEDGAADANRIADLLSRSRDVTPTEIRHSGKLRAQQTAEIFADKLGQEGAVREAENLAPLDDVSDVAGDLNEATDDVMLVGHLPHLNKLASLLVCGDESADGFSFQQGGALCLERRDDGGWAVAWMVVPQLLGAS